MDIARIVTDQVEAEAQQGVALVLVDQDQVAETLLHKNRPTTSALVWGARSVDNDPGGLQMQLHLSSGNDCDSAALPIRKIGRIFRWKLYAGSLRRKSKYCNQVIQTFTRRG
jgi:hypothetical protein